MSRWWQRGMAGAAWQEYPASSWSWGTSTVSMSSTASSSCSGFTITSLHRAYTRTNGTHDDPPHRVPSINTQRATMGAAALSVDARSGPSRAALA